MGTLGFFKGNVEGNPQKAEGRGIPVFPYTTNPRGVSSLFFRSF